MSNPTATESVQEKIAGIIQTFFQSLEDQRYDGIEALFHPDGTMWDIFVPHLVQGAAERSKLWAVDQAQFSSRGAFSWSVEGTVVNLWGRSTAIATYYLTFEFKSPNPVSGYLRITDVLRLGEDGRWLIVHHYEGTAPTAASPTTE